jgi:hypothetical protein
MAFRDLRSLRRRVFRAGAKKMPRPCRGRGRYSKLRAVWVLLLFRARFAGPLPLKVEAVSKGESVEQVHRGTTISDSARFINFLIPDEYTEGGTPASSGRFPH